jgi:hypothetical protein
MEFFGTSLWRALVDFFFRWRRFTNKLESRIRDLIVVLHGNFSGAADVNDEVTQKTGQLMNRQVLSPGTSL